MCIREGFHSKHLLRTKADSDRRRTCSQQQFVNSRHYPWFENHQHLQSFHATAIRNYGDLWSKAITYRRCPQCLGNSPTVLDGFFLLAKQCGTDRRFSNKRGIWECRRLPERYRWWLPTECNELLDSGPALSRHTLLLSHTVLDEQPIDIQRLAIACHWKT